MPRDIHVTINYEADPPSSSTSSGHVPFVGEASADPSACVPISVPVLDARSRQANGDLNFKENGFALLKHETKVNLDDLDSKDLGLSFVATLQYIKEMTQLIKDETGADHVDIFAHQLRDKSQASENGLQNPFANETINGYVNVVHTDFSSEKATDLLLKGVVDLQDVAKREALLGEEHAKCPPVEKLLKGRYMLVNVWQNIRKDHPIHDDTLACCDAASIDLNADMVRCDVPLEDKTLSLLDGISDSMPKVAFSVPPAKQYRLAARSSNHHRWYYFPEMRSDEVLIFKQYDSDPRDPSRICFHTSFADPAPLGDGKTPPRKTIELRAIVFFPDSFVESDEPSPINVISAAMPPISSPLRSTLDTKCRRCEDDEGKCDALSLDACRCDGCSVPALPDSALDSNGAVVSCGYKNASNPYHTCVSACGCTCLTGRPEETSVAHEVEVPDHVSQYFAAEERQMSEFSEFGAYYGKLNPERHVPWAALLADNVIMRHSFSEGGDTGIESDKLCGLSELHGISQAFAAAASFEASPFRILTQINRYFPCPQNTGEDDSSLSCGVVEGEYTYDHKLLPRASARLVLPFRALCVFVKSEARWKLLRKHAFSAGAPLADYVRQHRGNFPLLKMSLFAGASNGLLEIDDALAIYDTEVLAGRAPKEDHLRTIHRVCADRKISYNPQQWGFCTGL